MVISFLFRNFAPKIIVMEKIIITILYLYCLLMFMASCSGDSALEKMERIKIFGNDNPKKALAMLDSLKMEVRDCDEYARSKYDLLQIRLSDKADIMPISDIQIKQLVEYFEQEGTDADKQEVYYYAGSVYRDLQDTPRALENFFKSLDYAKGNDNCDSIMLRNTYSNLCYLQAKVHNNSETILMAKEELRLSKELGEDEVVAHMQLAAAYYSSDSINEAKGVYDMAFRIIKQSKDKLQYQEDFIRLLCDYSKLNELDKARECIPFIEEEFSDKYLVALKKWAFAQYYNVCGKKDSAIIFCKDILESDEVQGFAYNAAKQLYRMYDESGDFANAAVYARKYMQLSDSLDFGKRQELAATVNNAYKYNLDQKREQKLKDEKEQYKYTMAIISVVAVFLFCLVYIIYVRRRNVHLKEMVALSEELQRASSDGRRLQDEIARIKEHLEEKTEQNRVFISLLHQTELERTAEDVIESIRLSAEGKKNMTNEDWKQLYKAVDELYPDFREQLLEKLGAFKERQMQVCYLLRIGMSNAQIQNITGISRATVWRWAKKFELVRI